MRKIKFLNGVGAMFAFAVVALATTFTSCEKEEFNVDVTPVNAKAVINPIVLAVENGVTTDVTGAATVSGTQTFEGNPNLAETTSVLTVTYKDFSTEISVKVPALTAGQFATLTPTVVLQQEYDIVVEHSNEATEKANEVELVNLSDYWYKASVRYTVKSGVEIVESHISTNDMVEKKIIQDFFDTFEDTYTAVEKEEKDFAPVYAHSKTIVSVTYTTVSTKYEIMKAAKTKAEGEVLATMTTKEYTTSKLDASKTNLQIEGHNHAPAGHGHGHGHGHGGYDNAGGGIINAD